MRKIFERAEVRTDLTRLARERDVVSGHGALLNFVNPDDAGDTPYELHIARTGRVPTRTNPHDLFNAAVWLTFPRTKATLNARQAQAIAVETGDTGRRGAERDAATLFDESGLILALAPGASDDDVFSRIVAHDWAYVFLGQRARWHRDWVPWLVGHAVMEKLVRPYAAITVRVGVVVVDNGDPGDVAAVDAAAAAAFARGASGSPAALPPMPVLGIPGWWPANESPGFYDDPIVFRPRHAGLPSAR